VDVLQLARAGGPGAKRELSRGSAGFAIAFGMNIDNGVRPLARGTACWNHWNDPPR